MAFVKIKMNTWQKKSIRAVKFKRNIAAREGYIDYSEKDKKFILKETSFKCKPWDTSVSRKTDISYIQDKKDIYSGLCFKNRKDAETFMNLHKEDMDKLAAQNPLFTHWSIMNIIEKFTPKKVLLYGRDIIENNKNN